MNYKTENQILEVIEGFESCTIKRDAWGHPEHLIVAYHYSLNNDYETALEKMRDGIFNLLETFEVDLKKEMPYHETLTVFWMNTINEYAKGQDGYSVDVVNKMIENYDKDYPSKFYTRERLFSDEARKTYVEPDLVIKAK